MSALDDARAEVERRVQAGTDPTLAPDEVDAILAKHLRAATWAASTAYSYGAVVVPTARNGHRYRAIYPGTSGATQPTWGTAIESQVSDGSALVWQEEGSDFANPYDMRAILYEACELKETKCSDRIDFSADGASFQEHQTPQYWRDRKRAYAPAGVA